ncbi:MAG TPA: protein arginine kinase [Planctomycetaceae bacterium]|nr:protein arginine kinase [Pirellulales bacterium]HAL12250.1 protein arginine kinase [Planctomycetaceae bacterium]HCK70081.1 protein arginine kinase [Planctomycetaceae bacterium]
MSIDELAPKCGEWLKGSGPESDIVISSRIRLARNLADFPFIRKCSDTDRMEIETTLHKAVAKIDSWQERVEYVDVSDLSELDRQFLMERQLISREHSEGSGARSVAIDSSEQFSLMINEEDHLRIQVMQSGFDLHTSYDFIDQIDNLIEQNVNFAFHARLGYLTACPTNVGTGMRVSVMLHLPALVMTREIDRVLRSMTKINLAVRGLYGEGSQAMGDFYQISNQVTLGRSERDLIDQISEVVPVIIEYERNAREFLKQESRNELNDKVKRALGILNSAESISSEETMHLLSSVRMGVNLGILDNVQIPTINKLFIHTQPAHLQKLHGMELSSADRNAARAQHLRRSLQN